MSDPHDIADGEILVTAAPGSTLGRLRVGPHDRPCALGPSGLFEIQREGAGGTPVGCFPLRALRYRADRLAAPETGLPVTTILPDDGWCDAPGDPAYNRPVRLPYPASAEAMWRHDHLYDLVVLLGHNDDPVVRGAGSAIFFHLAKEAGAALLPTEGCVALRLRDMLTVLPLCDAQTTIRIERG